MDLPVLPWLRDVVAGPPGVFVAVGDDGLVLRTTDGGESWTQLAALGLDDLDAVTWGDGVFVAVGDNSVFTSGDGVAWTDRSGGTQLASWHSFKDVLFVEGVFYAGGWYSGVQSSSDGGVTWQSASILGDQDYDIRAMAYGEGAWVAAAERRSGPLEPVLLVSGDGVIWVESSAPGFPDTGSITIGGGEFLTVQGTSGELSRSGGLYPGNNAPTVAIAGPGSGSARTLMTYSSTSSDLDGDSLVLVWDFGDGSPCMDGSGVVHSFAGGGTFPVTLTAIDGRGGVTTTSQNVTITDPLVNWTTRTSGTTSSLYDITLGGGKLVTVGSGSGTYRSSTDGITWTGGTLGSNITLRAVVHDGSQFIAVGQNYDFGPGAWKGVIYTSPDGSSWTQRLFSGEDLRDVAYGGGTYVAVGDNGTMWNSPDGLAWSPVGTGLSEDLDGVAFGGGMFVAVGSGSGGGPVAVLTSPDGTTWTDQAGGAGTTGSQGFYDVQYCGDRFLASGWFSKLRHSTDGGATFSTNQSGTEQIPAFAYGNGIYFAAGIDKDNSNADINLLSTDGANWSDMNTASQDNREAMVFYNNTFITVGQNGSIQQSDPFTAPESTGFFGWQALTFPGLPALSGPLEDYDGDGFVNLIEYVTGSDAKDAGDRPNITSEMVSGRLRLTIPRTLGSSDVTVRVQYSPDLLNWSPFGVTVIEDTVTSYIVELTGLNPGGPGASGYLRPLFILD